MGATFKKGYYMWIHKDVCNIKDDFFFFFLKKTNRKGKYETKSFIFFKY